MALKNKLMAAGLAMLAVAATAGAALAAPAYVTSNVNVRSGPGTGYGVVDTLRRGEQVDVQQCRGSWCYVEKRGPSGWVSANYLERGNPGWDRPPPRPPQWDPYPPRPPQWNPGPSRPPYWGDPRPPRPPVWGNPGRPNWGPGPSRPYPVYPGNSGSNVCFNGPQGYVCMGN